MKMSKYEIPKLPLKQDVETKAVLKRAAAAHRRLAESKGVARTIPNEMILMVEKKLNGGDELLTVKNLPPPLIGEVVSEDFQLARR